MGAGDVEIGATNFRSVGSELTATGAGRALRLSIDQDSVPEFSILGRDKPDIGWFQDLKSEIPDRLIREYLYAIGAFR